jgi:cysteine synthase A
MQYANSLLDLIGNTPLLKLARLLPNSKVFVKCEFMNPMSVKDRPVLQIIEDAETAGLLRPGSTLIETTSGNTGMAVAYIAAIKGYRAVLVMSEIQSIERRQILKAYGAELVLTPADEGTAGARKRMKQILSENPDYFYVGQHVNPSNPKAHYRSTGPEIWDQTSGKIDILVAALGTGGTICGAGRYLREQNPEIQLIAVEPEESPFISKGIFKPHRIMGTSPGFIPETLDKEMLDEIFLVNENQAFEMCRTLSQTEGMLVGISSGAAIFAAAQVASRHENQAKNIVVIAADTGQRYLSVKGLFD